MEKKQNKNTTPPQNVSHTAQLSLSCTTHVCKISGQKSNHSKREYINSHDVKFNFVYLLLKLDPICKMDSELDPR